MMGFNNIELISDRPIEVNLREIAEVKRRYPKHVVIASLDGREQTRDVARYGAARGRRGCGWA